MLDFWFDMAGNKHVIVNEWMKVVLDWFNFGIFVDAMWIIIEKAKDDPECVGIHLQRIGL
jgi:hypothetical protein